jgi:hypothetical protein
VSDNQVLPGVKSARPTNRQKTNEIAAKRPLKAVADVPDD